ncbi:hypothetical protein [Deinococcus sonorensis]|uniref:Uncharacterized protein n=2 Tax=Deinococcus sonorensis TaxID=309891 RepID=A0AAU7U737_9DEIO
MALLDCGAALTIIQTVMFLSTPASIVARGSALGWIQTVLSLLAPLTTALGYVLIAQVVQRTMGPEGSSQLQSAA